MLIADTLKALDLPPILRMNDGTPCDGPEKWAARRREILDLFAREVYGTMPPAPTDMQFAVKDSWEDVMGGGGAYRRMEAAFTTPGGPFSFEFDFHYPYADGPVPAIVFLQFQDGPVHATFPVEKIIRSGYAVARVRYDHIMKDCDDLTQGLGSMYLADPANRAGSDWGEIGAWAFGGSRVMDFLQTQDNVDKQRIAVTGLSRLGKTTLWCAANDERFAMACIVASGNTGASLSRAKGPEAESIAKILEVFPYWFAPNYLKYAGQEMTMPFDQHLLAASLAPRPFYVCSGSEDGWAGPVSEYLCCAAASEAYEMLGLKGFVHPDALPEAGWVLDEGSIAYSMHAGKHFMGEFEWDNLLRYMASHL